MMVDMPSLTAATWTQGNNVSFDTSEDEIKGTTTGEQTGCLVSTNGNWWADWLFNMDEEFQWREINTKVQ